MTGQPKSFVKRERVFALSEERLKIVCDFCSEEHYWCDEHDHVSGVESKIVTVTGGPEVRIDYESVCKDAQLTERNLELFFCNRCGSIIAILSIDDNGSQLFVSSDSVP